MSEGLHKAHKAHGCIPLPEMAPGIQEHSGEIG